MWTVQHADALSIKPQAVLVFIIFKWTYFFKSFLCCPFKWFYRAFKLTLDMEGLKGLWFDDFARKSWNIVSTNQ